MIRGYKTYKKGLINKNGEQSKIGQVYSIKNITCEKSNFCFCPRLEDVLAYHNGLEEEIDVALVEGTGQIEQFFDEYYDANTILATEFRILKVLTRE